MNKRIARVGAELYRLCPWLMVAFLVACSGAPSAVPSVAHATPTPAGGLGSAATATAAASVPLTLSAAWGAVTMHKIATSLGDNRALVFENAATPDGAWLVAADVPRDLGTTTTRFSSIVLYQIATGRIVPISRLLTPASQVLAASADDQWVVWSEVVGNTTFFDWTIFIYNRQSGQVQQLARATQVNGQPVPGPYPTPFVDHDHVLWSQAIGPVDHDHLANAVVRLEDLTTGQVSTLASGAAGVALSWPWALWDQTKPGGGGYVALRNLESGQTSQLDATPASMSVFGASVAYDDQQSVSLLDDITHGASASGARELLVVSEPDHAQFVTLNDRIVAWQEDTASEVYDRAEHRLITLPTVNGHFVTWVGKRTLVWEDPETQDQMLRDGGLLPLPTIYTLDTATLPVLPQS